MFDRTYWKAARQMTSAAILGLLGVLAGCGGGGGVNGGGVGNEQKPPPASTPTLQSIEVTPSALTAAAGTQAQFTATGVFTDNSTQDLTGQVIWASSNEAVATVSNDASSRGLATAAGIGSTTVTATSGVVNGNTTLTVTDAALVSIEVSPATAALATGLTQQFTATGVFTDRTTQDLTGQVTWSSSNAAVATVSNVAGSRGLATAAGVGSATMSATSGDLSGETTLAVTNATLVSIEVSPNTPSMAQGLTQQFTAIGVFTDHTTQDLTDQVTWASSNGAVAAVSNGAGSRGLATAASVGSTTVTATSGGVSGNTTLTVSGATLVSIEVSPAVSSLARGLTQQFTATGVFTDGSTQDLTTQVTWGSSDGTVATVSNAAGTNGLATALGLGGTTVRATSGSVSGDTTLTVTGATLASIEVTPAASSLANGLTRQFTATGIFTDNSTQDLTTQVTWGSSDETVATVSNADGSNGLVISAGAGNVTVSATSGDVSGDTTLTVTDATLASLEVTPATSSLAHGLTRQFTATGHFTDGSTQDLTSQVTWASSDEAVATVSNAGGSNGLAKATAVGTSTVSATSGGVSGDTTLTVTDATLVSIDVSSASSTVASGLTQQFTATGHFTDGTMQDLTAQVTWGSSDEAVATVSNADGSNGLATGAAVGSATVSATGGGVSGNTTLTVTDAALVSIDVSPALSSVASGLTRQFTATGHFTDGSTQELTAQVTWGSSDVAVATVSNADGSNGLATASLVGSATVSAMSGDVTGTATLTVTAPDLVSIDVSPETPSVASGESRQFTATGHFTDGSTQDLTTQVTWASSDEAVATISNATGSNGLATGAGVGSTTVSATSGGVNGSSTLIVTPGFVLVNGLLADLLVAVTDVGTGASLATKVEAAQAYLSVPDIASACTVMSDFKLSVAAQSGKKIPVAQAAALTADAEEIEAAIPCP